MGVLDPDGKGDVEIARVAWTELCVIEQRLSWQGIGEQPDSNSTSAGRRGFNYWHRFLLSLCVPFDSPIIYRAP